MKYIVMSVAFALVAGTPASGQQNVAPAPGGTSDQGAVQKKAADRKKICRRVDVTGSIMRETVCRTVDQWAAEEQASRADAERMQNNRSNASQSQ